MGTKELQEYKNRPTEEYLIQSRDHRVTETFSERDIRYQEVDAILRGEFGYKLPGDNVVSEKPMVMNLGLAFTNDVARLSTEQYPVYKAPLYSDKKAAAVEAEVREVVGETYWDENRGDLSIPQQAMDLVVCGAAYTVCWTDPDESDYPLFTRVDPRHAYPNIINGQMYDLLVIEVMPAAVAEALFPGKGIYATSQAKEISDTVEIWQYYSKGYSCRAIAHQNTAGQSDPSLLTVFDEAEHEGVMLAHMTQIATPDGAIRGMLDQIGDSLMAKNKVASLMTKYTEQKVFAPWEAKGIINPDETPGPNTVYMHNENAPGETFMRRTEPAGSDPALFALMNLLDLDQRGAIGYPASRQGEVSQSIASAAFVDSTQGQLSSVVKQAQLHLADLRANVTSTCFKLDVQALDFTKPMYTAVGNKATYKPSTAIGNKTKIRVIYGAGAGMSRQNADTRLINLLGARLIPRSVARENIEFLRNRADLQDEIEMENAEDALQQLFWPDPSIPMDMKFAVKSIMMEEGLSLEKAYARVKEEAQQQQATEQAPQPGAEQAQPAPEQQGQPSATAAQDQALALEKGQQVQNPQDIALPSAPLEQIFVSGGR